MAPPEPNPDDPRLMTIEEMIALNEQQNGAVLGLSNPDIYPDPPELRPHLLAGGKDFTIPNGATVDPKDLMLPAGATSAQPNGGAPTPISPQPNGEAAPTANKWQAFQEKVLKEKKGTDAKYNYAEAKEKERKDLEKRLLERLFEQKQEKLAKEKGKVKSRVVEKDDD